VKPLPFDRGVWIMAVGALIAGFGRGLQRGLGAGLVALGVGVFVVGLVVFVGDS
jgi:hypothetical protein